MILKIFADIVCGSLNSWGGYSWHNARRFIMPCVIGLSASLITHIWYAGLMVLPVMGTLCLGYSVFGGGNFSRACWLLIQALVIGLGLTITGHVSWIIYVPYVILAGVLGGLYKNLYQPIGDFIAGFYLGLIFLWIK